MFDTPDPDKHFTTDKSFLNMMQCPHFLLNEMQCIHLFFLRDCCSFLTDCFSFLSGCFCEERSFQKNNIFSNMIVGIIRNGE